MAQRESAGLILRDALFEEMEAVKWAVSRGMYCLQSEHVVRCRLSLASLGRSGGAPERQSPIRGKEAVGRAR